MVRLKLIIVSFLLSLPFGAVMLAKEWRGIIPMHSNRADVERLLGKPNAGTYYDFEDERAQVVYVEKPCESTGPLPGFNVPTGTVSQIRVIYKKEKRKSDLRIDESKFIKTKESDTDWHYYSNGDEGIMYIIYEPAWERNGIVGQAIYSASASDEYLRCSKKSSGLLAPDAPPNNGLHPTRDTPALILRQGLGRAGDAGRWASSFKREVRYG